MDGRVYTPGAGHRPPVLVGRGIALRGWRTSLNDVVAVGRVGAEDALLTGPRGVGKTALLSEFAREAREHGFVTMEFQAARGQGSVVDRLVAEATDRARTEGGAWERARELLGRLTIGVSVLGASAQLAPPDSAGLTNRDPGVLAQALAAMADGVRGDHGRGGVMFSIDEMQVARDHDLTLIAAALHRLNVEHPGAAVLFAGTGLPHTPEVLSHAGVTHPDRLFVQQQIPVTLDPADAAIALTEPAARHGVSWHPEAVATIVSASNGHPAHLQVMAHATWQAAAGPDRITAEDARAGASAGADSIAQRSLAPRLEARTDRQLEYLAALAALGGNATVRQLESVLGRDQRSFSRHREELINEGDIYAPRRGHVRVAVPLMVPFVLSQYEQARSVANDPDDLVSLTTMHERARALPRDPASTTQHPGQLSNEGLRAARETLEQIRAGRDQPTANPPNDIPPPQPGPPGPSLH